MRRGIAIVLALLLSGCAAQRAEYFAQRDAPDLNFKGPIRPVSLSSAQIKQVEQGVLVEVIRSGHRAGALQVESARENRTAV